MKVVGKISGIRFDFAGDLVLFARITEIDGRVDATNLSERHFHHSVDRRLLVIVSILSASNRERLRSRMPARSKIDWKSNLKLNLEIENLLPENRTSRDTAPPKGFFYDRVFYEFALEIIKIIYL